MRKKYGQQKNSDETGGSAMGKKIIAVNAGSRMGWNTDTLITEASRGAGAGEAEVVRFDLFRLEKYTGCFSFAGYRTDYGDV